MTAHDKLIAILLPSTIDGLLTGYLFAEVWARNYADCFLKVLVNFHYLFIPLVKFHY